MVLREKLSRSQENPASDTNHFQLMFLLSICNSIIGKYLSFIELSSFPVVSKPKVL
jgi:hypothetical protein